MTYKEHCSTEKEEEKKERKKKKKKKEKKSEISYNSLLLSSHKIASLLEKTVHKELEKSKSAIPSCAGYLARAIYKLRLNSWNSVVRISYLLNTYCLNVLLPQSYFRKIDNTLILPKP